MINHTRYGDRKEKIRTVRLQRASEGRTILYSELGSLVGIPATGPWKPVLDEISREETGKRLPDITYLVLSKKTKIPAQIGFKSAKPPTPEQRQTAKETTQKMFAHYRPNKAERTG